MTHWDIEQARELYSINKWGANYFDINAEGEAIVQLQPNHPPLSLYQLSQQFAEHGLSLPVLVRFANILHQQVDRLCNAFQQAMALNQYQANYTAVYPIKVNQQRHVVETICRYGGKRVGLEAGSKAELMALLALEPQDNGLVVCNGYKDQEYIRLALIGQQLGLRPYLVIEKASELDLIISAAQALQIQPLLGVRVRLASLGAGKWQNTGGEKAKFGLAAEQLLQVAERIKAQGWQDQLQLMHFHIGSQIANIRDIQKALREAAQYYAELRNLGLDVKILDVGGGLGVDYDGTQSRSDCSINYSIDEYANNVVYEFANVCLNHNLPQPDLVTEAGRAMTAYHAVLITNITGVESVTDVQSLAPVEDNEPEVLRNLWYSYEHISQRSVREVYHDAVYWLSEAHSLFSHGLLNLPQRAQAEQLYYAICAKVRDFLQQQPSQSKANRAILDELNAKLVDKYFANFSLFQSMPDAWAIDQLFPIMPLHRLHQRPERRATLQDLTCDSDGQFNHYVDGAGVETSMSVHTLKAGETYVLGMFLVGAYQEILGDIHNLFGDTFSVNVIMHADGSYELVNAMEGDTAQDVLNAVNYDADFLRNAYRRRLQKANLTTGQRQDYLRELESGLLRYTYLAVHNVSC